ncbi:MAG: peptidoglycan DD-metalloendopeptidase family protein [Burkholderiales bacterium]|nr:peptidoglycan DD-metalloendopeptidase family protein [Burkholderiales bacterium]
MKLKLLYLFLIVGVCYADNIPSSSNNNSTLTTKSSSNLDVSSQVNDINKQINNINKELSNKQSQKHGIDAAIKSSQIAINKSNELLKKLRMTRDADLKRLKQLEVAIPSMEVETKAAKDRVANSTVTLYQQLKQLQNQEQSILSGNDSMDIERKRVYMTSILQVQVKKYNELNSKLTELQNINEKLQREVERLSKQLGENSKSHDNLLADVQSKQKQADSVYEQIHKDQAKLSNLKKRQSELNSLMKKLANEERKRKLAEQKAAAKAKKQNSMNSKLASSKNQNNETKHINSNAIDNSVEDNSPFMSRNLVRPYSGSVISSFGQMRDGVKNNGILIDAPNGSQVVAVSNGSVLFSGALPGFGQIVVIDNGSNYTSIYSGIIAKVKKGASVNAGSVIGSTGSSSNQPMGGVYFELRSLGKPVNPSKIF